uniref:Uncharacterized protein n=1 Tax=Phenylobacterium glaciei TaxID=2803784 RepID=A0A974P2M4_9CAUL|nr:hypothetical protein JKL49_24070 [Phenylobacterium glaciei]
MVWGATQYWAHLVLSRLGRIETAQRATAELGVLIEGSGFREFYSAVTGRGHGAGEVGGFTWPALILEMAADAPV